MKESLVNIATSYLDSPLGLIEIKASDRGLVSVLFANSKINNYISNYITDSCIVQLNEYFNKKRTDFELPLDVYSTPFQKQVWDELTKIPFGKTVSYQYIARCIGDENAVRAVGSANGKNKIAIIIPCHRVIGNNGDIVGYAGGIDRKRWLLDFEKNITQPKLF